MNISSLKFYDKGMVRAVTALAIPSVIANITTPLLSMADVAIMGRMGSATYLAAIAVGGTMFNMLYWLLGFLRMGSSGLTAQAFGRNDTTESSAILIRALSIAIGFGLSFILLRKPLCCLLLYLMDPDTATIPLATDYFMICIWGAPAALGLYAFNGWFLGMQSSRIPMWISIAINLINIATSVTLVFGMSLGIRGVATGTLIAQWTGFIIAVIICVQRFRPPKVSLGIITHLPSLKKFFSINSDIFLRTVCLIAVTVWFTRVGARQGAVILAANALLMQFFTLFSYFMDGFAFAAEALCGRFHGSHDRHKLSEAVRATFICGLTLAAIFTVGYIFLGDMFFSMLSDNKDVIASSKEYFWWGATIPFAGIMAFAWDGVAIGTSQTRLMLKSVGWSSLIFFTVWYLSFPALGNHGLWLAFILYLLTRGLIFSLSSRR